MAPSLLDMDGAALEAGDDDDEPDIPPSHARRIGPPNARHGKLIDHSDENENENEHEHSLDDTEAAGLLSPDSPDTPVSAASPAFPSSSASASSRERRGPPALELDDDGPSKAWHEGSAGRRGSFSALDKSLLRQEMLTQALPVMLVSLVGAIMTGLLLEKLQQWRVFIRIEELFILVPILLNLKGNLEMNLAARFSTSANIGELDLRLTRRSLVLGNLALLQVQALLVSLLSGLIAFVLGMFARRGVHHPLQHPIHNPGSLTNADAGGSLVTDALRGGYFEALLVLCVSMLAASISSAVLGGFTCSMVILCRRFRINPDNIATPLAAALGDLVTLVILGGLSGIFAYFMGTIISTLVFIMLLASVAVNVVFTFRNAYVQELLTVGWGPLFSAMAISSGSGIVLEAYVNRYAGYALVSPVLMALSGAAGAVYASRISTALHAGRRERYAQLAGALFAVTTPVLCLFLVFIWVTGQVEVSLAFAIAFVLVVSFQVLISLVLAYYTTTLLWRLDYDPDVYALPLLTSFLDVTAQILLVAGYSVAQKFGGGLLLEVASSSGSIL